MYIGAFDIGGTKTIVAVSNEDGRIYEKRMFPSCTADCYGHLERCCEEFLNILDLLKIDIQEISAIGVTLPGIVDLETGVLKKAVFAGWHDIPVRDYLSGRLRVKNIICENDVNACAEGEIRFGYGKIYSDFGWITVSTGVGGAVVCNGKLIRGAYGSAGEIGHLKVEYDKPEKCPCGQKGCLEAHGSGTALTRMIKEHIIADDEFKRAFDMIGKEPTASACAQLAENGNETAKAIFEKMGEYLGRGISYYINIMDPQAIVIGGGVAASAKLIIPGIRKAMGQCIFSSMDQVEVVTTALGYEAALIGAVAVAVDALERK